MKKIAILGSTGSIGTQTLNVIKNNGDKLCVHSLVAFSNSQLLSSQAIQHDCNNTYLISRDGIGCLVDAVMGCDIVVVATRGIVALDAVMYCIEHNIDVAIANKEVLVTAGRLVMQALSTSRSRLLPVDSEHSAIWQCIANNKSDVDRIYLTASGGALFDMSAVDIYSATAKQALAHPNWSMGDKITIDSATMMNKALEVVEASWLFDADISNITIVVHRQSIVHSMVQFADNSIIAQMSCPDMKLPIQYALLGEHSEVIASRQLDIFNMSTLTFSPCDYNKFPCASLASVMLDKNNPLMATVVNSANDACVDAFLSGAIVCGQIYEIITHMVDSYRLYVSSLALSIENIKLINDIVYSSTKQYIMEITC